MTGTSFGTCHFPSFRDACIYFQPYFEDYDAAVEAVRVKLENEEIFLAKPFEYEGETAFIKDNRWHICKVSKTENNSCIPRKPCNTTPMTANAKAKNAVAEQVAKDAVKPKGPTMAQFVRKPRPLLRGGRDVG